MKLEEGKEYIAVEISGEPTELFPNIDDARQYINSYKCNDCNGYYDAYGENPVISVYVIKVNKTLTII